MPWLLLVTVFFGFLVLMFGAAMLLFPPASSVVSRVDTLLRPAAVTQEKKNAGRYLERALAPFSKVLPKSPDDLSETRQLLTQAGYREPYHVVIYQGIRVFGAIVLLLLFIATGVAAKSPIILLVAPALGYLLPQFLLKRRITARQERIRLALPDALDLTMMCMESGLALDQALSRVGAELQAVHPDLGDEFMLLTLELRAGKARPEALRNFAKRTGVDDVRNFVTVLIQTDRFGTSVAQALRVHSDALRVERRQRAEERAAKTGIKMIPPLVIFIFPVMFFVILGPVVISFIRNVSPNLH